MDGAWIESPKGGEVLPRCPDASELICRRLTPAAAALGQGGAHLLTRLGIRLAGLAEQVLVVSTEGLQVWMVMARPSGELGKDDDHFAATAA